jgi:clan AA aspartic protease
MGIAYADLTLLNAIDVGMAESGLIKPEEVRKVEVRALVDTGSSYMTINESIQTQLGLQIIGSIPCELADGKIIQANLTRAVTIRFSNREIDTNALVLPGITQPLLGAIPMQAMDTVIDMKGEKLIVHPDHPYKALLMLK